MRAGRGNRKQLNDKVDIGTHRMTHRHYNDKESVRAHRGNHI